MSLGAVAGVSLASGQTTISYTSGDTDMADYSTDAPNNPTTLLLASGFADQSGVISGTGAVIKMGDGDVTLSGANTYTGGTTVREGALSVLFAGSINHAGALLNVSSVAGAASYAQLYAGDGGVVTTGNADFGSEEGERGYFNSYQPGSLLAVTGTLNVGRFGEGLVEITNGSAATAAFVNIGLGTTGEGRLEVLDADSTLTVSDDIRIGSSGSGELLVANGGELSNGGNAFLGENGSGSGLAVVTGADSTWDVTGTLNVGFSGEGELRVEDGGVVAGTVAMIGTNASGSGSVLITGADSRLSMANNLNVGLGGDGVLRIEDGGTVTTFFFNVGSGGTGTGDLQVRGAGSTLTSTQAFAVGLFGDGTMLVEDGAVVTSASASIGQNAGSLGEALVTGVGSEWNIADTLNIGVFGSGTLRIEAGGLVTSANAALGVSDAVSFIGDGSVYVSGPGSSWVVTDTLEVGVFGYGYMEVSNGGEVSAAFIEIGREDTGINTGVVEVTGDGSVMQAVELTVGYDARGELSIQNQGYVTSSFAYLGLAAGSTGSVSVSGADSLWNVANDLIVGASGDGAVIIEDGGVAQADLVTLGVAVGTTGRITVQSGGTLEIGNALVGIEGSGSILIENGSQAGSLETSFGLAVGGYGYGRVNDSIWRVFDNVFVGVNGEGELDILNGGQLDMSFGGPLTIELAQNVGSVGTINIGAGNLAGEIIGADIVGGAGDATVNFNHIAASYVFDPIMSGSVAVNHIGAGVTTLTADHTYTGPTTISAGALLVEGSLTNTEVTVASGGTLGGSGIINGAVTVQSGGVLAPGSSPGVLNLGSLLLDPGSTTRIEINGTTPGTEHDQIVVAGNATLDGTLELVLGYSPVAGSTFTLIEAGDFTLAGDAALGFAEITSNLGAALQTLVDIDATTFNIILEILQLDYAPFALTPNQRAVAENLDTFATSGQLPGLFNALNALNDDQLRAAFDQLGAAQLGSLERMARQYNRGQTRNLFDRLQEWRRTGGGVAGVVSTKNLRLLDWNAQPLYAQNGGQSYAALSTESVRSPGWGVFVNGSGQFGDVSDSTDGYDFDTGGITVGFDRKLGRAGEGDVVGGFYVGFADSSADLDRDGGRVDADAVKFGAYLGWFDESGLYLQGQLGGGSSSYDTRRNVLGARQDGDTRGYEFTADIAGGREWTRGKWRHGVEASFAYAYTRIDGFTETGGLGPLAIARQNADSLQSRLGWTVSYEHLRGDGLWLRPQARLGWAHEFMNPEGITASFAGGGAGTFTTTPARAGRDTAQLGASLHIGEGTGWNGWIGYDLEAGDNLTVHNLNAGVSFRF